MLVHQDRGYRPPLSNEIIIINSSVDLKVKIRNSFLQNGDVKVQRIMADICLVQLDRMDQDL
jgi:hypothetical protein